MLLFPVGEGLFQLGQRWLTPPSPLATRSKWSSPFRNASGDQDSDAGPVLVK